MRELIRPSTILAAKRSIISIPTKDGLNLVGEVASPLTEVRANLLALHPLPTHGGMMDSHLYKKAANRLPAMANIRIIRFNTRGSESEAGKSEGSFDNGESEKFDVEGAIKYVTDNFPDQPLWVVGWSFGTDLALQYARDPALSGLILLSPPLRTTSDQDLLFWAEDGRPITALVPEFDDFLQPVQARERFSLIPQIQIIAVENGKHLWVGEPAVYRVLTEIVTILNPDALPLPREYEKD